jgi:septal ring factor EnvC (AmiA/AmiB activator)
MGTMPSYHLEKSVEGQWHLDKKVTLGLIVAIMMNAFSSIWWAASLDSAVRGHDRRLDQNDFNINALTSQQSEYKESLARIQEGLKYQTDLLKDVRADIRKSNKDG